MATQPYDDILKRAQAELTIEEQSRLVDELSQLVGRKNSPQQRSILELEGLGKEVWNGVDPDAYVAEERDSWDG